MIRREFAKCLEEVMRDDKRITLITGDLGYKMWDSIRDRFPDRFINVGAAEQVMMDIAIGMAQDGRIPFVYSITPFLIYRPYEALRTYINHEKTPVKMIGGGTDFDYMHDGFSHYAHDVRHLLRPLMNITVCQPYAESDVYPILREMIRNSSPYLVLLKR